jgi:hypothetical protein
MQECRPSFKAGPDNPDWRLMEMPEAFYLHKNKGRQACSIGPTTSQNPVVPSVAAIDVSDFIVFVGFHIFWILCLCEDTDSWFFIKESGRVQSVSFRKTLWPRN